MLDGVGRVRARLEPVQQVNLRLRRQEAARRNPFAEMGDEESSRAGAPEGRRGPVEADPVGVRLDHRGASAGSGELRKRAPVVGERGEIDGQKTGRAVGRRQRAHESRFSSTATVGASKPAWASTKRR